MFEIVEIKFEIPQLSFFSQLLYSNLVNLYIYVTMSKYNIIVIFNVILISYLKMDVRLSMDDNS